MGDIDSFAADLLEQARAFFEKGVAARSNGSPYLHASLLLGFCSLDAHINGIADDYQQSRTLPLVDQGILCEREVKLEHGEFRMGALKMYRLEDRLLHLHAAFGTKTVDRNASWWSELSDAIKLRNRLTHPRSVPNVTSDQARRALLAIIFSLHETYQSLYNRPFPTFGRGVQSKLIV